MTAPLQDDLQRALGAAYHIERELGGGGMSRVFVADERALGRKVVVKILPPDLVAGLSVERFRREIQLAAQLQHPNIVPVLATGDADGLPWFTMPFVSGESLRARLTREGALPVRDAVAILRDVASALEFAHSQGIVHRDIKPDNVLLAPLSSPISASPRPSQPRAPSHPAAPSRRWAPPSARRPTWPPSRRPATPPPTRAPTSMRGA